MGNWEMGWRGSGSKLSSVRCVLLYVCVCWWITSTIGTAETKSYQKEQAKLLNSTHLFVCLIAYLCQPWPYCGCGSARRLKLRWMVTHNESLHSLSSTKDNLLRFTFHDSLIPLSSRFFSHHWNQNRISRSGRLPHWVQCVCAACVCVHLHTRWIRETENIQRTSQLPLC